MIKNYLQTAWRNLIKNKTFSLINILGLSVGMAASILILEYFSLELSYDDFNKNAKNIYRIYNDRFQNGKLIQHSTMTYSGVSKAMRAEFPEIIDYTRVEDGGKNIIVCNDKKLGGQHGLTAENSFLAMFSYHLLAGDYRTALAEPYDVVLTKSLAEKLFSLANDNFGSVLGKAITIGRGSPLKITGVCEDVPENSHLQFDFLLSYITLYKGKNVWQQADYDFTYPKFWHYIQLKAGTNYHELEAKFVGFSDRHFQGTKVSGSLEKFYLEPLLSAHLYSDYEYEIGSTESPIVVWGLFIIAALILTIAWINYVNLSTAKSLERAKEVGVRKVAGATRGQLVSQFMTESLIINLVSLIIAIVIIGFVQKNFNAMVNHHLSLNWLFKKGLGGYSFSTSLIISILIGIFFSGFYPSFFLSSFNPANVLKGKFKSSSRGIALRKTLVIGQFTITVALIISSIVVYKQLQFVNEQDLGFNMSRIVAINGPELSDWDSTLLPKQNTFISAIKQIPGVSGAAFSWRLPGTELSRIYDIHRGDQSQSTHFTICVNGISPDFISLYEMKMLAGRTFENYDFNINGIGLHNVILNATAVSMLGFDSPEKAVGQDVILNGGNFKIVGVVSDFHQESLHSPIEATFFQPGSASITNPFSVKVGNHNVKATISAIEKKYDAIFPGNFFMYSFLDEKFDQQYNNDRLFGRVFAIFSALAILIACLGLLGLSLYSTFQRTNEIGIRKILGASIGSIVILLVKDFILLILIAIVIAIPIAWYFMHNWLQNFMMRIDMNWWIFAGSGLLAIAISFITISIQSMKAALANPVDSLRNE